MGLFTSASIILVQRCPRLWRSSCCPPGGYILDSSRHSTSEPVLPVPRCFGKIAFTLHLYCRAALETVDRLTESLDFTDYASRIIHPIVRTLDQSPELRSTAMDTLSSLVFQLGKKVRWDSWMDPPCYLPCLGRKAMKSPVVST